MSRLPRVAFLTAVWVLLWGELSAANVVSGVAVSIVLLAVDRTTTLRREHRRRPSALGLVRLGAHLVTDLVVSNVLVLREVVRRRSRVRPAIVTCPLIVPSETVMAFMANVLSLTPGTVPVELRPQPPAIVLHVLNLRDPVELRESVARLERLAVEAFGTADERVAIAAASTSEVVG